MDVPHEYRVPVCQARIAPSSTANLIESALPSGAIMVALNFTVTADVHDNAKRKYSLVLHPFLVGVSSIVIADTLYILP